jgi:predicted dehydrogenase
MGKPYGLGLVGAGAFGEFCLKAYAGIEDIEIVAVADSNLERARALTPEGALAYGDYDSLLADPNIQIVAINTPPYLHAMMVRQAAEAEKHVFVEKPLATSLEGAISAVQDMRRAKRQLSINYVLRHHPLHKLAQQVTHHLVLGAFQHWSLENFATDEMLEPDHWFWDRNQSGGIHVEHGVHFFDLCNQLVGTLPTEVIGSSQYRSDGRLDRVAAIVRYEEDVLATFYHSFNQIRRIEQTTIRLGYTRGHIDIVGWIPTRLTLEGFVDDDGLSILNELFCGTLEVNEHFQGSATEFHHGGTTEWITAAVSAEAKAPHRLLEYQRAIQSGMRDLVAAIDGKTSLDSLIDGGLYSLGVALAASGEVPGSPFMFPKNLNVH